MKKKIKDRLMEEEWKRQKYKKKQKKYLVKGLYDLRD